MKHKRFLSVVPFVIVGCAAVCVLLPQAGNAQSAPATPQPAATSVTGAASKATVRQQAKQAAASKPASTTRVSFQQPIALPNDI